MKGTAWHPMRLLSSLSHRLSLGGNRNAKASLENTPGLPTRMENYFWIEVLAHCHLWQNSHWSQHSQDFTSVAAILSPCPFCLGTSSQHNKGLNSAKSFCTAGRSHETLHISKQILIKQLGNWRHCWTARESDLYAEAWCFTLAHHSKTNLILTNFLSFTKTCL